MLWSTVPELNTYDVLLSDDVVFSRGAFEALVERQSLRAGRSRGVSVSTDSESEVSA